MHICTHHMRLLAIYIINIITSLCPPILLYGWLNLTHSVFRCHNRKWWKYTTNWSGIRNEGWCWRNWYIFLCPFHFLCSHHLQTITWTANNQETLRIRLNAILGYYLCNLQYLHNDSWQIVKKPSSTAF